MQLDLVCALIGPFRWRAALVAEIFVLRHQLNVLQRKSPKRLTFSSIERLFYWNLSSGARGFDVLKIMRPETLLRGHAPASELIGAGIF